MATLDGKVSTGVMQRVLVVDDETVLIDLFRQIIADELGCQVSFACNIAEARELLRRQAVDLLVTDVHLPDGDGMTLVAELHRLQPVASALVVTGSPSLEGAIAALRGGALDFIPKPFSATQLAERVQKALLTGRLRRCRESRFIKLKDTVKRLNVARRTVSKKVDLLCNDLIAAYSELSRQMDGVRIQASFSEFVDRATNLEQLLCHSMDWLLRQLGYSNIGIWLASAEQEMQLGAFMKYTIAAEQPLTEALQNNLLRLAARRTFVHIRCEDASATLTPAELRFLANQEVLAMSCTYLGETLGVLVLFRDHKTPFSDDDVSALKTIGPLFALALARAVRGMESDETDPADEPKPGKRRDPADWWKNGEDPPF